MNHRLGNEVRGRNRGRHAKEATAFAGKTVIIRGRFGLVHAPMMAGALGDTLVLVGQSEAMSGQRSIKGECSCRCQQAKRIEDDHKGRRPLAPLAG